MSFISSWHTGMTRAALLLVVPGIVRCAAPVPSPAPAGTPPPAGTPAPTRAGTPQAGRAAPAAPASPAAAGAGGPISPGGPISIDQQNAGSLDSRDKPVPFNDPPASPDTPLCGRQAREVDALGASLQGSRAAASGICASFACYDPLTATYTGADGYRHVCR